jgi:hypothetical protein
MPDPGPNVLPGSRGADYRFVRYGDRIYVVYRVKLPNGQTINVSWRVEKDDYKALDVNPKNVRRISRQEFSRLNVFGSASEIADAGDQKHPFQKFIKDLQQQYRGVSWLSDKEFMEITLMGYAEGWDAAAIEQAVRRTEWYQSRTDAQRNWELEVNKADKEATLQTLRSRMAEELSDSIYGPGFDYTQHLTEAELKQAALSIASGQWGHPEEGFQFWAAQARNQAERIEGTNAWIERQQALEFQRAFMNRPEDVREQIRQEAVQWLGPRGVPDDSALTRWAENLVAETRSDADWQQFLRNQAKALYPFLGPEEMWMDRASIYKRIVEENFGTTIGWDNSLLYHIGEQNPTSGEYTGNALSYDAFERIVRSQDDFWKGPVARREGSELFAELNNIFQGVR